VEVILLKIEFDPLVPLVHWLAVCPVPPAPTVIEYVVFNTKPFTDPLLKPPAPPPPESVLAPAPPPATTKYSTVNSGMVVVKANVPVPAVNLVWRYPLPCVIVSAVNPAPTLAK
jgi:hypothetical protein